jgi:hypothetical protein
MKRIYPLLVGLLLAWGQPAQAAPLPGASAGLEHIPARAPLVLHLRGIEGVKGRALALVKNALPDLAPLAKRGLDSMVESAFQGRKLQGLKKDGPLFLVFLDMPKPGHQPTMAFLWAVDDYKTFRDGFLTEDERKGLKLIGEGIEKTRVLGEDGYFLDHKGFAVMSPTREGVEPFTKKFAGLNTRISRTQADKLLQGDMGLYLSMDVFNKEYATQIKEARRGVEEALKEAEKGMGKAERQFLELARQAVGPIFQAVEDSQGILLTAEFRPEGLALHAETELRAGTPTARLLKDFKPVAFNQLARLPAGQTYYIGVQSPKELLDALGPLLFGGVSEPEGKEARNIQAAIKKLIQAGPGVRVDSMSLPPTGLQVWQFEDPAKAVEAQLELMGSLGAGGTIQTGILKEKPIIKKRAATQGGFTFHQVKMTWDLERMAEQSAGGVPVPDEVKKEMVQVLKKYLGEEANLWFGSNGKVYVQLSARNWEEAKAMLESYQKGTNQVGDQAAFQRARKELPAETTMLALVDLVRYLGAVVDVIKPLLGGLVPIPPGIPDVAKAKPSYMGISATLEPRGGSFDIVVTTDTIREFYKAVIAPLRAF